MSVIGFDIGNESCVIAAAKHGGIDVLLNDESKRETPAVISFADKQRFLGSSGAAFATANPKSTVSQIKSLIGKQYKELHEELKSLPFATTEGPRGSVLIELEYLKTTWRFTPVEILAMLFTHLKNITQKDLESPVVDCVIGIPSYFTDSQRREYLDAAYIAGLKPLKLLHDGTAIALGYGMYKTEFCNTGPTVVTFVDIGHCDTQVTVAAFEQGGMKILAHAFDRNLGGRDFDEVLFKHFASQFSEKYKIDVCGNARACVRLRASCEKVKRVLSANAEAPISIECLIGDTDVRGVVTREEFEKLSAKLLERVTAPCVVALKDCGLSVDKISTVELVGSGSRIPAITRVLTSFFRRELSRTLNASECVARGCALMCAMLSPTLQVREYKVQDSFPYSIVVPLPNHELVLFPKGSPFPVERRLVHTGNTQIFLPVAYSNEKDFPAGISPIVGHFEIGRSGRSGAENVDVKFGVLLNDHGIIEIGCARMMFCGRMFNLPFSENLYVTTTRDELHEAQKKETFLAEQDFKVEQCKDQRNTLESFVYDTRSKLSSAYKSFATDSEKNVIMNSLKETEDWLYEDSDDESEEDCSGKLNDLKKLLEPVENKYQENVRANAEKALRASIAKYRLRADSLPASIKEMINSECIRAEQWLNNCLTENLSPTTLSSHINHAIKVFGSRCEDMMRSKPSSPTGDEHVDSDQKEQPVDSDVNLDERHQLVDSEHSDQHVEGERPVDSNQREQPVDSNRSDQN
ncbi:putative Heat shock protein 70 family [Helianthus anomalus]